MLRVRKRLRHLLGLQAPRPGFDPGLLAAIRRDPGSWQKARAAARGGPRVLVATSVGGFAPATAVEGLLAVALTLRGAEVHFLLCDRALPACLQATRDSLADPAGLAGGALQRELCTGCFGAGEDAYRPLGLPLHLLGDLLSEEDRARAQAARAGERGRDALAGPALAEHALAGALRYYARGTLEEGPEPEQVLREYRAAALLTQASARALFARLRFDAAVFHHGIYVPQGVLGEVARAARVRVVNWSVAYRKRRFIFSHEDTYHRTLLAEPTAAWDHLRLDPEREAELMSYLASRWRGSRDWIGFHEGSVEERDAIARHLGVDFSRPCIGMLTNVVWDARLHYPSNAFRDIIDWARRTVEYFARRPELQLLIRVHPAEVRGTIPSRQPIEGELREAFPRLPPNVVVIPAGSGVSTYETMLHCDSVLVYGTKMAVEMAALGIPVVVAGEAWVKNKGLTLDARSAEEYFALLDRLPLRRRMEEEQVRRARLYAYHFFFRRMIPIESFEPVRGFPPFRIRLESLSELLPGRSRGLDVVCDGILKGTEFVYPAESIADGFE